MSIEAEDAGDGYITLAPGLAYAAPDALFPDYPSGAIHMGFAGRTAIRIDRGAEQIARCFAPSLRACAGDRTSRRDAYLAGSRRE